MLDWCTDRTSAISDGRRSGVEQAVTETSASTPTARPGRWAQRLRLLSGWVASTSRSARADTSALAHPDPGRAVDDRFATNVLVGYTNTRESAAALTLAGQLACRNRARLTVVAATDPPRGLWLTVEGITERLALRESVASELRGALRALPGNISITPVVVDLGLAHALCRAISVDSYDLIVLPATLARDGATRRLLSSSAMPARVAVASDAMHCEDPGQSGLLGAGRGAAWA
jgi:hypothetical protein